MRLDTIVEIRRWLANDRATAHGERLSRDRAIGRSIEAPSPADRVELWWAQIGRAQIDSNTDPDEHRLTSIVIGASFILVVLGAFFGAGVAGVAFAYDGRYPVNLFALLGLLVLLPITTLLFTLLLLPRRIPGLANLQGSLAALNPARWLAHGLDRYLDLDLFRWRAGGSSAARFSKWQLVAFAQWLAVGFYVGALVLALLLVAFTDLAFGWSTTLEVGADGVYQFLSALAAPWAWGLPVAVPDADLVAQSRYFRLGDSNQVPAARLGDWWPYVCMVVGVYGLLPRVGLLVFASVRLRAARTAMLLDDPQVTALLDRISTPLVQHDASVVVSDQPVVDQPRANASTQRQLGSVEAALVVWNQGGAPGTVAEFLSTEYGMTVNGCTELGSVMTAAELGENLDVIPEDVRRFVVVTKGWEPPLLEFLDLLTTLRKRFHSATVAVVPVAVSGDRVDARERDIWAHTLARLSDAGVYVVEAGA